VPVVVIYKPLRTTVGRGGGLRGLPTAELGATVAPGLLQRSGLRLEYVDDLVRSRRGARYGAETMCNGSGQGLAATSERVT
jgi:acetyl-CoA acetyltransferase